MSQSALAADLHTRDSGYKSYLRWAEISMGESRYATHIRAKRSARFLAVSRSWESARSAPEIDGGQGEEGPLIPLIS